jgi:predicted nucleotidyltransferase
LISDFPNLDVKLIDFAINHRPDYKGAWNICNSLAYADISKSSYDDKTLSKTFGCIDSTTENQFRIGIASRNFAYSLSILESYSDNIDQIFYAILNTMLELEKLMDNKYAQSDIKEYVSNWTKPDIYNMFMNTYEELKKVRSHSSYKVENSIIYLLGLLQFKYIPSVEVML